jgi:hypothetical protein
VQLFAVPPLIPKLPFAKTAQLFRLLDHTPPPALPLTTELFNVL